MKLGSISVVLFAALALGALLVGISVRSDTRPPNPELARAIEILSRHAVNNSARATQYESYAAMAGHEHRHTEQALFRALAYSRHVAAGRNIVALSRMGETFTPPHSVVVIPDGTNANIVRSAIAQRSLLGADYDANISYLNRNGYKFASRVLIDDAAIVRVHIALLERYGSADGARRTGFCVCPACGNTYASDNCDAFCPLCYTDSDKFIYFY